MKKTHILFVSVLVAVINFSGCKINADSGDNIPKNSDYTVQYFYENIENTEYTLNESQTKKLNGKTNTLTEVTASPVSGFTLNEIEQKKISPDGTTVVQIYYDRNSYTINFDSDGGSTVDSITAKYEATITAPSNPVKTGFTFVKWEPALPASMPAESLSVKAIWTENMATAYKVEHYQQNVSDNNYTLIDTENLTGKTNSDTSAAAKTYTGFTSKIFEQKKISPDGTTVVEIYYDRNSYTINFDSDGGNTVDSITAKYEATITAPSNPVKTGFTFVKWEPALPATMPAYSLSVKASWTESMATAYKVEHYQQNVSDNNYTLKDTENLTGKTNSDTSAAAKTYTGFTSKIFEQKKISPDGTTVVEIYYDRNSYTITYKDINDTDFSGVLPDAAPENHIYGAATNLPVPTKTGHDFDGWFTTIDCSETAITKLGATDYTDEITLYAKWTPKTYKITYIIMEDEYITYDGTPSIHIYGTITNLPQPKQTGYTFKGWYTSNTHTEEPLKALEATDFTSDITLYGVWVLNTPVIPI